MMELKDRIRAARNARGLTQKQVAEHFGIARVSVTQWELGETSPERDRLGELARLFDVKLDWLLEEVGQGPAPAGPARIKTRPGQLRLTGGDAQLRIVPGADLVGDRDFPIYAAAQGGEGHLIVTTDPIQYVRRPTIVDGVKNAYGLLVTGESMVPLYEPGDFALVNPHLPPERDTNVILYDRDPFTGEAEAMIKRLVGTTDRTWKLKQFNPEKVFAEHRADWPICHRVVGKYDRRR